MPITELAKLLTQHPIFASLKPTNQKQLLQQAIPRSYQKDEWIVHYGDIWPYLFVVEEGNVTALKESFEGRSLIVTTIMAEEIFWGLAFFNDDAPMPVALVASEACRIHLWSRERLLPMLLENGRMSWELSRLMVKQMQRASDIVEDLAFHTVTSRLARLLLGRYQATSDIPVARDLTLDEMAARIGSTREMVCRALYRFADDEMIRITRTEFIFTNREKLAKLTQ